jgi:mannose-6-phosphate isomerase-like protein (cupin superfamily)
VARLTPTDRPDDVAGMVRDWQRVPRVGGGYQRCFYTLWGREEERLWETVPNEDLVDCIVEGTGRQDWRKLRPFDLLPLVDPVAGGMATLALYAGECVRVACSHIVGAQPVFERAGDYDTILFQFAGTARVETSFGPYELRPGEALHIPAIVAHRTIGSRNCRRMEYYPRDLLDVKLAPEAAVTESRFAVAPEGEAPADEPLPEAVCPPDGRVREHLTHWDDRPGEDYLFNRTYEYMVGQAETGRRPTHLRIFDYFTTPADSAEDGPAAVRTALLWESATFRQRVYANPGRQPAPHRGYDEDEFWFQFSGSLIQETEHGIYRMEAGNTSMAEAGISHTSVSHPGALRLTSYTPKPLRLLVEPGDHLRETRWQVAETVIRGLESR